MYIGETNVKKVLLTVKNFQKTYRNYPVLVIDCLEIEPGIHWFEGVNGSGKSTFFRIVAGIIPFEGEMYLNNVPNNKANAVTYRQLVSYAYAEPQYPDYLSGFDIIEFVRQTRSADKTQMEKLVDKFGVNEFYKNAMQTYSSGMLKKISLITAFIGNSALILLDEPFTTIDSQTSELLYELITKRRTEGSSFFIASHQPLDAEKVKTDARFLVSEGTIRLTR